MELCRAVLWVRESRKRALKVREKCELTPLLCEGTGHSQDVSHGHHSGCSHQVGFECGRTGCSEHIPRTVCTGSRECSNSNTDGCCSALPSLPFLK